MLSSYSSIRLFFWNVKKQIPGGYFKEMLFLFTRYRKKFVYKNIVLHI